MYCENYSVNKLTEQKYCFFCITSKNVNLKPRWKFKCRVFWPIWTKLNIPVHVLVNWWLDLWNAIREILNQIIKRNIARIPSCELLPHMVVESLEVKGEAMLASPSFTIWAFSSSSISLIILANFFCKTKHCLLNFMTLT